MLLIELPPELILELSDCLSLPVLNALILTARSFRNLLNPTLYRRGLDERPYAMCKVVHNQHAISTLIHHGFNVNHRSGQRLESALHCAARLGVVATARLLLDHGADIDQPVRGHQLQTPLSCAVDYCRVDVAQLLISRGANVNALPSDAAVWGSHLHRAIRRRNLPLLKLLVNSGSDPNHTDTDGVTPLMCCARIDGRRGIEFAQVLLDAGAEIDAEDRDGWSAYDYAMQDGNMLVAEYLNP